eukprot:CAMPEP_0196768042 /NCGR_PEP_ID=MMETSP1095-20130614/42269_1 /TAXON_ID=96789 ORGANISM="Chromulina nebulosa, Strain UTEXLB2642" /NCGR_SAMPLE_ID=MMETSP1095 /ASSEMBLY_ACC=CAM_ASM_000446 /LENGTH=184 /DNA_ID=CAMNT_0042137061 /DNA_START=1345 /DNA_END=1900 /DNA_ORIENTATION=-
MKPKAAMLLKKTMEKFVSQAEIVVNAMKEKQTDKSSGHIDEIATIDDDEVTKEIKDLQNQIDVLTSLYNNTNNSTNNKLSNDEVVNEITEQSSSENVQSQEGFSNDVQKVDLNIEKSSDSENATATDEIIKDTILKNSDNSPINNNNQINSSETTNKVDNKSNEVSKDSSLLRELKMLKIKLKN